MQNAVSGTDLETAGGVQVFIPAKPTPYLIVSLKSALRQVWLQLDWNKNAHLNALYVLKPVMEALPSWKSLDILCHHLT